MARSLTSALLPTRPCRRADMYHGDEDTEAVWANFPQQKGLVEREFVALLGDEFSAEADS